MNYPDKPAHDDTQLAHPAYWRGKSKGFNEILAIVSNIMIGNDNGTGVNNHPDVESMRRALLTWRQIVNDSMQPQQEELLVEESSVSGEAIKGVRKQAAK